jgi:hypothetical protein
MNRKSTVIMSLALITWLTLNFSFASARAWNSALNSVTITSTPIKHLVSFDHYFGTYPNATNPPDEPKFITDPHTPSVNRITAGLLSHNPNGNYYGWLLESIQIFVVIY